MLIYGIGTVFWHHSFVHPNDMISEGVPTGNALIAVLAHVARVGDVPALDVLVHVVLVLTLVAAVATLPSSGELEHFRGNLQVDL